MGFCNNWQRISTGLSAVINDQYQSSMFFTNWSKDIEDILVLLKLLPSNRVGKNALANRDTFYKSSEKLVVFLQVIRVVSNSRYSIIHSIIHSLCIWSVLISSLVRHRLK